MLKINDNEFNEIIHSLLKIASILRAIENGSLSKGQREILHCCEKRLREIRQKMLEYIKENDD